MTAPRESWCSVWRKPSGELGLRIHAPWMQGSDWSFIDKTEANLLRRELTLALRRLRAVEKAK